MKMLTCLGVLTTGFLATTGLPEEFATEYLAGDEIRHEGALRMDIEFGDMSVLVNGNELPPEAVEAMREEIPMPEQYSESFITHTTILGVEDGQTDERSSPLGGTQQRGGERSRYRSFGTRCSRPHFASDS